MQIETLDYHTAGEPLRIVTDGLPDVPGATMLEKRRYMMRELDDYRRLLMHEPRGHADMYGAVLTDPVTEDGDTGVLFLHNEGYSTMCGHGIIALATAAIQNDVFPVRDASDIRFDTPAGRISARANRDPSGEVESVTFKNVPSFVLEQSTEVRIEDRSVPATIAFGGAFYAYVEAGDFDLQLIPSEAPRLIELGRRIKRSVSGSVPISHPSGQSDLDFLYGTIFVAGQQAPNHSRNVCIFADGELDRSPTGTGVSGRAAIHHARGDIGLNDELVIESIVGTAFRVRCVEQTTVADREAVIPEVTGSAHISGKHTFYLDPGDPLQRGFLIR